MATDGDGRKSRSRSPRQKAALTPSPAQAKTEALTPERRAELMAAAEARFRQDSEAKAAAKAAKNSADKPVAVQPAGTLPSAVRVNSSRNKVEPLSSNLDTESGLHVTPHAQGLEQLGASNRTTAMTRQELEQLKGARVTAAKTGRLDEGRLDEGRLDELASQERHEAGFDAVVSGAEQVLEPTAVPEVTSPSLVNARANEFEGGDATVAYMPDLSSAAAGAPSAPTQKAALPSDAPGAEAPAPDWIGNARPVDLQRPTSGAPSAFSDVATGFDMAALPGGSAAASDANAIQAANDDTAATASAATAPAASVPGASPPKVAARQQLAARRLRLALLLVALTAVTTGSVVVVAVFRQELKAGLNRLFATEEAADLSTEEAADLSTEEAAAEKVVEKVEPPRVPPQKPSPQKSSPAKPAALAVAQVAVRFALVDDVSESALGLGDAFGAEMRRQFKVSGPFRLVLQPVADGFSVNAFLTDVEVEETDTGSKAEAKCTVALGKLQTGQPERTMTIDAKEDVEEIDPDGLEEMSEAKQQETLATFEYALAGRSVLLCARSLVKQIVIETGVTGPPSDPTAAETTLPTSPPPAVEDKTTRKVKKKRKKRRRRRQARKKRRRHPKRNR